MDNFDEIYSEIEQEGLKMSRGLNRILLGMWKNAQNDLKEAIKESKRLKVISIGVTLLVVLFMCYSLYLGNIVKQQGAMIQQQQGEIASIQHLLESGVIVEETTTETETVTIEQDTGDGNGTNVYQAGEGSTYTQVQGGGEQ